MAPKYRKSKVSRVVSFRLPNSVLFTLERRVNARRSRWCSVGEYLKERIIYDLTRKHERKAKIEKEGIKDVEAY